MKKKMNQIIKTKRKAMIKGEMRMMGTMEKHHHIQECATMFKEITPIYNILDDIEKGVAYFYEHYSFVSYFKPFKVEDALRDPEWVVVMQEELNNFKRNQVWSLVKIPKQNVVGIKWVFHNKQDEHGIVTRNKA
jgi:hypothetical protein